MIPAQIERYLQDHHVSFEPRSHRRAVTAERLAHAEHVAGARVAKPVVVRADGRLVLAVVAASQHLDAERLRRALGAHQVVLAPEESFAGRFPACEAGAEPALALYGLPIFVDARLSLEPRILMRAGTHEDAVMMVTDDWILAEHARIVDDLGTSRN